MPLFTFSDKDKAGIHPAFPVAYKKVLITVTDIF
jgi:hypothetical protein